MQHRPLHAITLIDELALHESIFVCDGDIPRYESSQTANILDHVQQYFGGADEMLWLAATVSPFRGRMSLVKKKEVPTVSAVLSEGLKVSRRPRQC